MSAHTPGPWRVKKATVRGEVNEWYVTDDGGVAVIASCVTDTAGEPSEANARLIAAAPELLEVIDGLLNALPSATAHPAIKAARAAIAKATGGAA